MKYINQLEHRDIPYEHNLDHGGVPEEKRLFRPQQQLPWH